MKPGYRFLFFIIVLSHVQDKHLKLVESKSLRIRKTSTQEDVCKDTVKTVNPVNRCPSNDESMQERARDLNCKDIRDSCSTEELVFHCVPSADKIVEVCAPRYYVDGKYCVQFDGQIGRVVVDYRVPCQECPFRHYSNDSAKYTSCNKRIQALSNVLSMTSTDVPSSKSTSLVQSTPESNIGLGSWGFGILMVCVALSIMLGVICISVAVGLNVGKGSSKTAEVSKKNEYLDPYKGTLSYHALK